MLCMGILPIHVIAVNGNDGCESPFSPIRLHNYLFGAIRASLEAPSSRFCHQPEHLPLLQAHHEIHFTTLL